MTETRRRSLSIAIEDDNVDWNVATGKRGSTRLGPPNLRRLAIRLHGALYAGMELEPRTSRPAHSLLLTYLRLASDSGGPAA